MEALVLAFGLCAVASLLLTGRALATPAWWRLAAAAACSLFVAIVSGFSIGPLVIALALLQLAGAVSLRWHLGASGSAALLGFAVAVWLVGFPGHAWSASWTFWLSTFALGLLALAWPCRSGVRSTASQP